MYWNRAFNSYDIKRYTSLISTAKSGKVKREITKKKVIRNKLEFAPDMCALECKHVVQIFQYGILSYI